jgi:hypothetical protein
MTMAVSEEIGSFCSVVEGAEGADDAVEDVIFSPFISLPRTSRSEDYSRRESIGRRVGKIQSIGGLRQNKQPPGVSHRDTCA